MNKKATYPKQSITKIEMRERLAETLSNKIHEKNLTYRKLHERTGISVDTIKGYVCAERESTPSLFNLYKIAIALNTTIDALIAESL